MKKILLFLLSVVLFSACDQSSNDNLQLHPTNVIPGAEYNAPTGMLKEPVVVPGSNPDVLEQKDDSRG
ncbi:MAG: hypothetical protein NTZ25_05120 [Candidatus Peregrinibacteria bacterium]|nr:hypothetical protein [Candidatus Peregrinibacteria bacterium]